MSAREYLECLFQHYDWEDSDLLEIRLLGEKGTGREGTGRQSCPLQPSQRNVINFVESNAQAWRENSLGAFVVPAILSDRRGTDESVRLFTSIVIDIDSGDTDAKLEYLRECIGRPTMLVTSGGHTKEGQLKYHVYYCLDEPTDEIATVARLRKVVAQKCGADQSFGRIPQVVRIPGTAHGKDGADGACELSEIDTNMVYGLDFLEDRINVMTYMPGTEQDQGRQGFDFTNAKDAGGMGAEASLTRDVKEGGDGAETRWSEFSKVAGHYIHSARSGGITLAEAEAYTAGWVAAHMDPPWPDGRVEREFRALVEVDVRNKGPVDTKMPSQVGIRANMSQDHPKDGSLLLQYAAHSYLYGPPPPRRFLVEGLVLAGKPHLFAAEGGAGKTYSAMDLGLKVAAGVGTWMGQRITEHATGAVVILTAEDDKDEIHLRMEEIDPGGELRKKAGDKLIILPLPSLGGTFPLVETDQTGNPQAHKNWVSLYEEMGKLEGGVSMVIIDTFSSSLHGEENSALVVNQWFRVATDVCGAYGAALFITHHIRKLSPKDAVTDAASMLNAIRGSTALPSNVRAAMGIWHDPNYKAVMKEMRLDPKPGYLYKFAVIKANNPEMLDGEINLSRSAGSGLLVTDDDARHASKSHMGRVEAWIAFTVIAAAAARHPYTKTGENGIFKRKGEFNPSIQEKMTAALVTRVTDNLVRNNVIEQSSVLKLLDRPGGFWITSGTKEDKATEGSFKMNYDEWVYHEKSGRIVRPENVNEA